MLFPSYAFLLFVIAVFALIFLVRNARGQQSILFLASFVFYGWWNPFYCILLMAVAIVAWVSALVMTKSAARSSRRLVLIVGVGSSLTALLLFKYADLTLHTWQMALLAIGIERAETRVNLLLPVGISFYTFQALSYIVDVYRGQIPAEPSLRKVGLYLAFFPQLVAGPIVRASNLIPAFDTRIILRRENVEPGLALFLRGLIKKVLIADSIAPLVDGVLGSPTGLPSLAIVIAVIGFAIQIYCDFSGYTDMAIGIGRCLGFKLPANFRWPYFSLNVTEFWQRWHISLSSWLRDYLYIPLGGSRSGIGRTYVNLMITMGLGGLWHGAGWNFLLWGIYHGALLVGHRAFAQHVGPRLAAPIFKSVIFRAAAVTGTFYLTLVGWVLFRVSDFTELVYAVRKFVVFDGDLNISGIGLGSSYPFTAIGIILGFVLIHAVSFRVGGLDWWLTRRPAPVRIALVFASVFLLTVLWPASTEPFIYFQF